MIVTLASWEPTLAPDEGGIVIVDSLIHDEQVGQIAGLTRLRDGKRWWAPPASVFILDIAYEMGDSEPQEPAA